MALASTISVFKVVKVAPLTNRQYFLKDFNQDSNLQWLFEARALIG